MKLKTQLLLLLACAGLLLPTVSAAAEYAGTARVGYIFVDEEGNEGVFQPTYNLYDGVSLSLDNFHYTFDNGIRLFGDLNNITLNNRDLALGVTKSGLFGVDLRHNQYRRVFNFEGSQFTKRYNTRGNAWFRPHRLVKLFGGLGVTRKSGDLLEIFTEPPLGDLLRSRDYTNTFYNGGVTIGNDGRFATFEYRGSNFSDDATAFDEDDEEGFTADRQSQRFRLSGYTSVPRIENLFVNAGAQRFQYTVKDQEDTLTANTVWGGARYFINGGWSLRYSVIWDRARRTGDLVATDNITHAIYGDKIFRGIGGLTVGYQYHINDDVRDEVEGHGYVVSGYVRPVKNLTLRAGHGADMLEVKTGRTLTGDEDRTRAWGSATWRYAHGQLRAKIEDRTLEHEEIGSKVDFLRASTDLSATYERIGEFSVGYAYYNGDYDSREDASRFEEHVVSGDFLSAAYSNVQAGFGGMYMRSRLDTDVESFTVRFRGVYAFMPKHKLEVIYSAHNFDNFRDLSPLYREYYTANVVELNLLHEF